MFPKYFIDWLGNVFDARNLHRIGAFVCGPDDRGYTVRAYSADRPEHVPAEAIKIQLTRGGEYVAGDSVTDTSDRMSP
jgi:hypothetical protein